MEAPATTTEAATTPKAIARSWDTSFPTLIVSVAALVLLPPPRLAPGISDIEGQIASAIVPVLWVALALAVATVASTLMGNHGRSGFFGVLSLVAVNVAGLLSWQYGVGGLGLLATIPVTAPFLVVMGLRESAWRKERQACGWR